MYARKKMNEAWPTKWRENQLGETEYHYSQLKWPGFPAVAVSVLKNQRPFTNLMTDQSRRTGADACSLLNAFLPSSKKMQMEEFVEKD